MSGCAVCVYDLYEESLAQYRDSIQGIRSSLTRIGIPETTWPASLVAQNSMSSLSKAASTTESAFEALERRLAEKATAAAK